MTAKNTYQGLSTELDTILAALQAPDVDIDTAQELYERGQKVIQKLQTHLQDAENTIRVLDQNSAAQE